MSKRLAHIPLSQEFLFGLFEKDAVFTVESGLPDDAKILGFHDDFQSSTIYMRVESEEFSEVPEGAFIPVINLPLTCSMVS